MKSLRNYNEIVIFDCETTGLDHINNHIIELGCSKYTWNHGNLVLSDQFNELINVGYILPLKITQLTGITDQMLLVNGKSEAEIAKVFFDKFINNNSDKKLFMAYNANFDINFVDQLLKRYNYNFTSNIDFLDVLTVFKDRAPYPHRLANAIAHFNLTKVVNSHRAIDDCLATFEVLCEMGKIEDDLDKYINLFGYNPKYPIRNKFQGITYKAQPYNSRLRLYQIF